MNNKIKYALISTVIFSAIGCSSIGKKETVITDEVYPIVDVGNTAPVEVYKQEIFSGVNDEMLNTVEGVKPTTYNVVYFPFDSYELGDEARTIIDIQIEALSIGDSVKVVLAGHTDERGDNNYNIILGEKRAKSVKTYLVDKGIDANNIEIVSFGEEKPAVSGTGESVWGKNRRVSFEYK